ncbi:MAG TPA: xylulokinase [Streptosporangiales bacterium]
MTLVAGVDSSTQSCKVVVVDPETGHIRAQGSAPHPDATEVEPRYWWDAFTAASEATGVWPDVRAVSVAAQQHGMVVLDSAGDVVRPALLWNDTRSAEQARALVEELGGSTWAEAVGSVPLPSFTVTKLAWLAEREPANAERVAQVMLPHDWLTWRLLGCPAEAVTDRSDASGTGYWSPSEGSYRPDLLTRAFGRVPRTPRVLAPDEAAGRVAGGATGGPSGRAVVGPGAGDNAGAALGLQAASGDVVVSIGTSGTVFGVSDEPARDATGMVAGFADAAGAYLPLVCTLNATRVLSTTADLLGVDHAGLDRLAASAPPTADGLVFVPYLEGERTPNLPGATASLFGLSRTTMTPGHLARAAVLGVLCGLADGLDELRRHALAPRRVVLIGGGARSETLREAAAEVFDLPVSVPEPGEYVALGAARQAAWVLSGSADPPSWPVRTVAELEPKAGWGAEVRATYRAARDRGYGV